MKKSVVLGIFLTALLCINLIGCGNTEQPKQNVQKKGKIMEEIKKRGKVIVVTEASLAPFDYIEDGKIVGYDTDILHEIVKNMGVELEHVDVPFSGIFAGLENKNFDFAATVVSVTPERKEKWAFTVPLADNAWIIVGLKDDGLVANNMADLDGKVIGCNLGSGSEKQLIKDNEILKAEGKKGFEIKTYPSTGDAFLDLKNGRVDALSTSKPNTDVVIKNNPDVYDIKFKVKDGIYLSWVVRKEDKDLLQFLNDEILKLKRSGKLAELQEKWFGTTIDLPDQLPE